MPKNLPLCFFSNLTYGTENIRRFIGHERKPDGLNAGLRDGLRQVEKITVLIMITCLHRFCYVPSHLKEGLKGRNGEESPSNASITSYYNKITFINSFGDSSETPTHYPYPSFLRTRQNLISIRFRTALRKAAYGAKCISPFQGEPSHYQPLIIQRHHQVGHVG